MGEFSGSVDSGCHELSENIWFVEELHQLKKWSGRVGDEWVCVGDG